MCSYTLSLSTCYWTLLETRQCTCARTVHIQICTSTHTHIEIYICPVWPFLLQFLKLDFYWRLLFKMWHSWNLQEEYIYFQVCYWWKVTKPKYSWNNKWLASQTQCSIRRLNNHLSLNLLKIFEWILPLFLDY